MSDNLQPRGSDDLTLAQPLYTPIKRRSFFMYAGATAGASALLLAGCSDDSDNNTPSLPKGNSTTANGAISLGSGDVGVLNFAYALEQLEADFYAKVAALPNGSTILGAPAFAYFQQVAKHEAIHRDFFKAALNRDAAGQTLRGLTPKYPAATFTDKANILGTAKAFEDLGVSAYNGAGKLIKTPAYLVIAGQIVSVEARHAAYIRDLVTPGSFAADDIVNAAGLDVARTPGEVLTIAQDFITEKLDGSSVGVN
ncbi:ferritin-like domain-containing protein [Hymenobacter glacialis]|uniref:Tat (Twin-arginine translocation) pathway signal sequence containing protein n=1 Tax=Hymenobacter glacialis TaxID=1908236 RepID=A0A1G1ST62_9BACT|nr:ferritin-like domain-containing protein [Hymenobacter glacialis]OGX81805.1 Tat (twin-arginine translocation) pathway signal sequence containing protein [Hymenobacter glacialis]